jgi:hypothetical protein
MRRIRFVALAALLALGCAKPPPVAEQAEALLAEGKLEEAADKLAAYCAVAPESTDCPAVDQRAAETRIDAAEHAMAEGRYLAAERLLLLAMLTDAGPVRDRAAARIRAEELATGRRYEVALALPDKPKTYAKMLAITQEKGPPNAATKRAAAWIEKERPAMLVAGVEAACKADAPAGTSCAEAYAELRKTTGTGPAWEAATALARAEAARVYPLRVKAEPMISLYVAYSRADTRLARCVADGSPPAEPPPDGGASPDGGVAEDAVAACRRTIFPPDAAEKRDRNDRAFQDLLAEVRDPAVVSELSARRDKAVAEGTIDKITIEKPEEAKR